MAFSIPSSISRPRNSDKRTKSECHNSPDCPYGDGQSVYQSQEPATANSGSSDEPIDAVNMRQLVKFYNLKMAEEIKREI